MSHPLPPPDTGRVMVRAPADTLRRDGGDLRAYALEREALHGRLVTEEESRARLGALCRLASLPALTQDLVTGTKPGSLAPAVMVSGSETIWIRHS